MMKRSISASLTISTCLLLVLTAVKSSACGSGSITITNLSDSAGSTFEVGGLNSTGQLTGYFYGSLPAQAFLYQGGAVLALGTLGGMISEGFALNAAGQVVGASYTSTFQLDAFEYGGGTLVNLDTLDGSYSSASLINDAGQIAGDCLLPNAGDTTAFLYSNGSMSSLGTLGGTYSSPLGLNNAGQVAGESTLPNGDTHAFLFSGAGLVDLGTLGGNYSAAFAINQAGTVVGESSLISSEVHGFIFAGGVMTDLGTLGGTNSSAFQINTNGQVIGVATTSGDVETHAFLYSGRTLVDLGTLGGSFSVPYAINNQGLVVGASTLADGTSHAFLWQAGQLVDLNTFLPAGSGWQLTTAQFINDAGRIVGRGLLNGISQWFILDLPSSNRPPVALAGPDQTVDCQAQVTLDGSGSSDPDSDPLAFEWSVGGNVLGATPILSVSLPLGTNLVTLKVTDPCGASAQTHLTVIVADTTPPTILSSPHSLTVSADANCQGGVPTVVSSVVATDNCTPAGQLQIVQSPAAGTVLPTGNYSVSISVTDASGNRSAVAVPLAIVDTTPPVIQSLVATPNVLSPPNHQLVPVTVSALVSDNCDASPITKIISITCSEAPSPGDIQITGALTASLAASKASSGTTRVYTITVQSTDASGNASTGSVIVTVPKSSSSGASPTGNVKGH